MALPEQIRKQAEAVQQLYQQLNAEDVPDAGETQEGAGTPGAVEGGTPVAADTPSSATPAPRSGDEGVSEETAAQKYRTLQGMYNAEVPRLHQQNRELQQRVQHMEQLLASLSAQTPAAPTSPQPAAEKLISDADVEAYGESLDVMRRVTREELGSVTQRLAQIEAMLRHVQADVVPQVHAVAQRQQVGAEQQFWADLAAGVPNFREINANEAFQTWLLEADPLTGITRQTYLDDAQRSLDARRVANFFHTWSGMNGQSVNRAAGSELERQVAPGRSRSAGMPAASDTAKVYTAQDIQKFFDDVRMGKYRGKDAERARIERDIFAAQRENRIQMNA